MNRSLASRARRPRPSWSGGLGRRPHTRRRRTRVVSIVQRLREWHSYVWCRSSRTNTPSSRQRRVVGHSLSTPRRRTDKRKIFLEWGRFASLFDDADDDEEGTHDRRARAMTAITRSSIVANVVASSPCISRASSPAPSETSSAGDSVSGLGEDRARWIRERVSTHLLARDAGLKIDKSTWSDIIENAIVEEVRRLEL